MCVNLQLLSQSFDITLLLIVPGANRLTAHEGYE